MHLNCGLLQSKGIELHNQEYFHAFGDVEIESPTFCAARLRLDTHIRLGAFCNINHNTEIGHTGVGRYTSIAQNCFIGADRHPTNWLSSSRLFYVPNFRNFGKSFEASEFAVSPFEATGDIVRIGNDVLIANNCIVNRGVVIGDGAIVAPGSVVTKDVPPYAIIGGSPAKVLKYRFDEKTIERLLKSCWWKYSVFALGRQDYKNPEKFLDELEKLKESVKPYVPDFTLSRQSHAPFLA